MRIVGITIAAVVAIASIGIFAGSATAQKRSHKAPTPASPSAADPEPISQVMANSGGVLVNGSPGAKISYTIYNLAPTEKKAKIAAADPRKEHSAFWLGSRLPALLDLYRQAWRMPEGKGRILTSTIEKMLDRHQMMLGLDTDLVKHFRSFVSKADGQDFTREGREFLVKVGEDVQKQGNAQLEWWTIGVGIGASWNTAQVGARPEIQKEATLACIRSLRLVREALQAGKHGKSVSDQLLKLELGLQGNTVALRQVVMATPDWLIALESEILVGGKSLSPVRTAEEVLDAAPVLAMNLLKRHLSDHPNDYQAVFLKGKAAAADILVFGPAFDPLLAVNDVWELGDSLERQIALRPDAPGTSEARKLLAIVAPIARSSLPNGAK